MVPNPYLHASAPTALSSLPSSEGLAPSLRCVLAPIFGYSKASLLYLTLSLLIQVLTLSWTGSSAHTPAYGAEPAYKPEKKNPPLIPYPPPPPFHFSSFHLNSSEGRSRWNQFLCSHSHMNLLYSASSLYNPL